MSNQQQPIRREIHPEVRIIDAVNGICDYIASDETLDCYQEIIRADGWLFELFKKNAPFVDSHDYTSIDKQLGKVIDFHVDGKQLVERVKWAVDVKENALAQLGWKMTAGGYLKAVSVGFFPVTSVSRWDSDPSEFKEQCTALKADPTQVRCVYTKQQQIELSGCIIGANPNALAKAYRDGAIKDADVLNIFQSPTVKNGPAAQETGHAADAFESRSRERFLRKLERAIKRT